MTATTDADFSNSFKMILDNCPTEDVSLTKKKEYHADLSISQITHEKPIYGCVAWVHV